METRSSVFFVIPDSERQKVVAWVQDTDNLFSNVQDAANTSALTPVELDMVPSRIKLNNAGTHVDSLLEGTVLKHIVHLVVMLTDMSESRRRESVRLLWSLSGSLQPSFKGSQAEMERIQKAICSHEYGADISSWMNLMDLLDALHMVIAELFQLVGVALKSAAIALVAAFECCIASPSFPQRDTCVTALSQLIMENKSVFVDEDRLAALWNLYFLLLAHQETSSKLRLALIKVCLSATNIGWYPCSLSSRFLRFWGRVIWHWACVCSMY